jgi:hypothetical protein
MGAKTTVGEFTFADGVVTGPGEYMRERGSERLDRILRGDDAVFNAGARFSAESAEKLVLVSLQTDYAGWKGLRSLVAVTR